MMTSKIVAVKGAKVVYVDNSYLHLPNFTMKETFEILAYTALHLLITDMMNNYTRGKIGFDQMDNIKFGGNRLTKGIQYLFIKYEALLVSNQSLKSIIADVRSMKDLKKVNKSIRIGIKQEIEKRLEIIGYWDYIPVPRKVKGLIANSKNLNQWLI